METAKEKQQNFIKSYLKPMLKEVGYLTSGNTWWKDKGDFFNVINLQNYSWNSQDSVDFRFNFGIAITKILQDQEKKKATYNDLIITISEGHFLPNGGKERKYGNVQGYSITNGTDILAFIESVKIDFEKYILPKFDHPKTIEDCVSTYGQIKFWGDQLLKRFKENGLV